MKLIFAIVSLLTVVAALPSPADVTKNPKSLEARVLCYEGGMACPRKECASCSLCGGTEECLPPDEGN